MHTHPANGLRGPVTLSRGCWASRNEDIAAKPGRPPSADPDIRWELVERIRREIADGTYESLEKLEQALDRLREELE